MRNFNIDLLRMTFAVLIVIGHLSIMKLIPNMTVGPLVVFFFVLTGYFTMAGYEKRKNGQQSIGSFMLSKLMSFLPYLIAAAIVTFVLQTILQIDYWHYSVGESIISSLMSFFGDVSCLSVFGMGFVRGNVAVWYLSGMMFGLAVTYPIVMKYGHGFSKYAAPVIGLVCIATCLRISDTLFGPYTDIGGLTKGMLESVGSICLGYFAYECARKLMSIEFTKFGKYFLGFIELACYIISVAMIVSWSWVNTGHLEGHLSQGWYELLISFLLFIAAVLTCSSCTCLAFDVSDRPILKKVDSFLATGSLVLYLSNYYQIYFVMKAMKGETLEEQILPITIFVVVSFIIVYIGGKIIIKLGRKLKSAMIVTPETE